jgi:hypothetical protein
VSVTETSKQEEAPMVNEIPTLLYFVRTWDVSVLPLLVAIS